MTNLLTVLPDFDVAPYSHILPSLERALVTTADLLTLNAPDVAKRAQVPPGEVKRLTDALLLALHQSTAGKPDLEAWPGGESVSNAIAQRSSIATLDDALDATLGGGISTGHLTEIVGER